MTLANLVGLVQILNSSLIVAILKVQKKLHVESTLTDFHSECYDVDQNYNWLGGTWNCELSQTESCLDVIVDLTSCWAVECRESRVTGNTSRYTSVFMTQLTDWIIQVQHCVSLLRVVTEVIEWVLSGLIQYKGGSSIHQKSCGLDRACSFQGKAL